VEGGSRSTVLAKRISDAVLAPAIRDLRPDIQRLLIVPDGPLHRLSFAALVLPDGRRAVERFAIGMLPSAGVAAALWRRDRRIADPWVLALGDPRFGGERATRSGDVERLARDAFGAGGLPRLPGSGD